MYTERVQYSSTPAAVSVLVRPDGYAEYRMSRNIEIVQDGDGNDVIQGDEVYFEMSAQQALPTAEAVTANFDAYWEQGAAWPETIPTDSLEQVRADVDYIAMETGVDI